MSDRQYPHLGQWEPPARNSQRQCLLCRASPAGIQWVQVSRSRADDVNCGCCKQCCKFAPRGSSQQFTPRDNKLAQQLLDAKHKGPTLIKSTSPLTKAIKQHSDAVATLAGGRKQ